MSTGASRPGRQIRLMLAVGILVCSAAPADTGTTHQLPCPDAVRDPVWIARLPPVTLPLPRLSAMAGEGAGPDLPAGPAPASAAPVADVEPPAPVAVGPGATPVATAVTEEGAEDSSRVAILERQTIGAPGADAGNGATPVTAPDAVARPALVTAVPSPATLVPAAPARAAPPPVASYRWQVQLLAGRSLDRVREDWRIFVNRHRSMLEGLTITISQSYFGDVRDEFYRLRVLDWTDKAAADRWCARLRAAGGQCFVTRVTALPE